MFSGFMCLVGGFQSWLEVGWAGVIYMIILASACGCGLCLISGRVQGRSLRRRCFLHVFFRAAGFRSGLVVIEVAEEVCRLDWACWLLAYRAIAFVSRDWSCI